MTENDVTDAGGQDAAATGAPDAPSPAAEPRPRAGFARWAAVVALTVATSGALAYAATFIPAFADTGRPWLVALVFMACQIVPIGAIYYLWLIGPTLETDPHAEESVESRWLERATSGAAMDTLLAAGIGTVAVVFTSVDFPVVWALSGVVALLMGSTVARYAILSRRGG
ncbi:hypothetical protein [Georgenia sp. Z1491]|uniref:hypothetical protein n=1 Tax=Georgenia sp. Z1491 TaxID=3416707 RepID=UPI003CEDFB7E